MIPVTRLAEQQAPILNRLGGKDNTFKQVLAAAGVDADTPATVLCDGDAGLWRLQRAALPHATVVLDRWHAAVRFEHALQAARGLGAGTAEQHLADQALVARALAGMPAQARGPVPLDAAPEPA